MSKRLLKSLTFSLVFHCVAVSVVFYLSLNLTGASQKQVIDFSLIASPVAQPSTKKTEPHNRINRVKKQSSEENNPVQKTLPSPQKKPELPKIQKKVTEEEKPPEVIAAIKTKRKIRQQAQTQPEVSKNPPLAKNTTTVSETIPSEIAEEVPVSQDKTSPPARPTTSTVAVDTVRQKYIHENFSLIRDKVSRNILYPPIARKMGWQGRVVVSFVVQTNGHVEDIVVVESCGFKALDSNAIKIIEACLPFPKPKIKARITLPIVYQIN